MLKGSDRRVDTAKEAASREGAATKRAEGDAVLYRICSDCETTTVVAGRRLCLHCADQLDQDLVELLSAASEG